ncbi:26S proteasome regulatory complex, subunit PSMD10 [Handroanthus impetiginosus]|uniref:RING-type E3 ubiquitin transferase n=1 Tax=Handroanthus impetiginosus TaxID=429701 RepID=A0A2G9I3L9_9LAMI|nr:26S proteasome regulatory complex, subunit PSMD10 [Handroanthus impetiginosus]
MGQGLSCRTSEKKELFSAVQLGDLETVEEVLKRDSSLIHHTTVYDRSSALHVAAASGQIEVLSLLLDRSVTPDILNRHKQTPLMLAAMHGKISCVTKLIEAGANILMFDSRNGRTCLHYAAYYGHSDCLQVILSAARASPVAASWGYSRFVNTRDGKGATALHLAARQGCSECVHVLLDNGAIVYASTDRYGYPGSTPLHLAARSGSLDCIRELLAWGAERLQIDAAGRIPYTVALRRHHRACAALLNPSAAEPLVWPSPLKFITELNHEAKALLERALMEANREREKAILRGTVYTSTSPLGSESRIEDNASEASETDLCCICFDQECTIEVQECGHRMCAQCTLALCCHNKPNPTTSCHSIPVCPFCRSNIVRLVVAKVKTENEKDSDHDVNFTKPQKSWRSRKSSEGSSSFRGLSGLGSFRRMSRGSGRIAAENEWVDKPLNLDI